MTKSSHDELFRLFHIILISLAFCLFFLYQVIQLKRNKRAVWE